MALPVPAFLRPNESLSVYQHTSYPNDAYQLGDALTRRHDALLEMMSPPEPLAAVLILATLLSASLHLNRAIELIHGLKVASINYTD
jgi:hypothetical protein